MSESRQYRWPCSRRTIRTWIYGPATSLASTPMSTCRWVSRNSQRRFAPSPCSGRSPTSRRWPEIRIGNIAMIAPLRILHLEDSDLDAELGSATLAREGIEAEILRVKRKDAFVAALDDQALALILSDYDLPAFDGMSALAIARRGRPDLPFIFVSDVIEESLAIEALKSGATDYVFKSELKRLGRVVRRALDEARSRKERHDYEQALRAREAEMRIITDN